MISFLNKTDGDCVPYKAILAIGFLLFKRSWDIVNYTCWQKKMTGEAAEKAAFPVIFYKLTFVCQSCLNNWL